mmetsp:Transcript_6431/g.19307  ORF Transcript_6431/g.19307 Transcript_6431/m.19307 type:complete len:231 (+) Transcript_6431:613-1305(+)
MLTRVPLCAISRTCSPLWAVARPWSSATGTCLDACVQPSPTRCYSPFGMLLELSTKRALSCGARSSAPSSGPRSTSRTCIKRSATGYLIRLRLLNTNSSSLDLTDALKPLVCTCLRLRVALDLGQVRCQAQRFPELLGRRAQRYHAKLRGRWQPLGLCSFDSGGGSHRFPAAPLERRNGALGDLCCRIYIASLGEHQRQPPLARTDRQVGFTKPLAPSLERCLEQLARLS